MRTYPSDSPQAAGRILAFAMLADGHLSELEIKALARSEALSTLGLDADQMALIVQEVCEDLLSNAQRCGGDECRIRPDTLRTVLGAVKDEEMHAALLHASLAIMRADGDLSDGEAIVLAAELAHFESLGGRGAQHKSVPVGA